MPTYEYRCEKCGEQFEVFQSFSDRALRRHPDCGGPLEKVLHPRGIVFKGSGFYVTDSRAKSSSSTDSGGSNGSSEKSSSSSGSGEKSGSSDKTGSSTKSESNSKSDKPRSGGKSSGDKPSGDRPSPSSASRD
jgi:putative FmdB family regulatory protein